MIELRLFDWHAISSLARVELLEGLLDDVESWQLQDLREGSRWELRDNWLPIGVEGSATESLRSYDDPGYFPQFSYLLLVDLDEFAEDSTPLYALEVSGSAIPSERVLRHPRVAKLGELELRAPLRGDAGSEK